MVIITQLQPNNQIVNLEKNFIKIIFENGANVSSIKFVRDNCEIIINDIFNNGNFCVAEMCKNIEPGKYLVSVFHDNEFSNELEYICYPNIEKITDKTISFSKNKVKINGLGFNDKTIVIAKSNDIEKNVCYDFINEREILCYIERYDCATNAVTLSFIVNDILSPSIIQLEYEEPIITAISSEIFVKTHSDVIIHGKNFGIDTNNIRIFIDDKFCNKCKIMYCENNQIKCQIYTDSNIGKSKLHIEISNIKSNELDVDIISYISEISDEYLNLENINKKISLYGNGFTNNSKLLCNNIINNTIEKISSSEISFFLENITNYGNVHIKINTDGVNSNSVTLKVCEYHIEKLSKNIVFTGEKTKMSIIGKQLIGTVKIIIESEQQIDKNMDITSENKNENEIEFEIPELQNIGTYYLHIIKNGMASNKYKISCIPSIATFYPSIIPISIDRESNNKHIVVFFKLNGKISIENMKLELFSANYSMGVKPMIQFIEYANEVSIFSFKMREYKCVDILNIRLYINDYQINTNELAFIPNITNISPQKMIINDEYNIALYGSGFDDSMKINANNEPLKYTFTESDDNGCVKLSPISFNTCGFNDIEITNQDNVKFNLAIFVEPIFNNVEFIIEELIHDNVFYIHGNGFSKDMNAKAMINDTECVCSFVSSDKILINLTNFICNGNENRLSITFTPPIDDITTRDSKYILPMYNDIIWYDDIIQFPFVIQTDQIFGLCNIDNSITIRGYGFDKFIEIKINEKPMPNIKYIHDTNTFILTIPSENVPKKYNIKASTIDGSRISNQIIYYTIPVLLNLSNATGPINGGNDITINGIGFLDNVYKLWFGNYQVVFNYDKQNRINCKIPENIKKRCDSVDFYIETIDGFYSNKLSYMYLPHIENLSTNSGNMSGNYKLSLYGTGFLDCNQVKFGEHIISTFIEHTNDKITILVPKLCSEHYDVDIQLSNTGSNNITSNSMSFTYIFPKLSHIEPACGFIRGNDKICIYGEGFSKEISLSINDKEIDFEYENDNNIFFHSSSHNAINDVDVNVIWNNTKSNSLNYSYKSQIINHISPSEGYVNGGYNCSICGEGFLSDNVQLLCGDIYINKCDFLKHTDEIIEFAIPSNKYACEVNIYVIINGIKSENHVKFLYLSYIKSLSASNCFVNTKIPVTIYGDGFTNTSIVKMGTTIIKNTTFDEKNKSITFISPIISVSQSMPITVITDNSNSNSILFTIKPLIKTINPQPWAAEDVGFFYVLGEGFSSTSLGCVIGIDNESKIIEPINSSINTLVFAMPYIKKSGNITVAIGNQICNENDWVAKKIAIYPKITKLSESSGPIIGGNKIEIIGKGFNVNNRICIDDSEYLHESEIEYVNENLIIMKMPKSNSLKEIRLSVRYNKISSNYVTYTYCPVIKSVKPNFASIKGGTKVIISGEGIDDNSIIYLNNKPCENMNLGYNELTSELSVAIPAHFEVESIIIKVVTDGIESNGLKFFYTPIIDNISLTRSYVSKKEIVTITGDGFCSGTAIKIGEKLIENNNIVKIANNNIQFHLPVMTEQCLKEVRIFSNSIPSAITKTIAFSAEFTSISPNYCPIAGGIDIHIYGYGFNNEIKLFFNEINLEYTLLSSTDIMFKMPKNIGIIGKNKINLICTKYDTQLATSVICYPSIFYSTQKRNPISKKATITLHGMGFLSSSTINFGDVLIKNHINTENTLKFEIEENNARRDTTPIPIHITTHKLKSRDNIFYNNIPYVSSDDKIIIPVNGGQPIVLYGYGFDEENTYITMDDYNKKIVPFFVTSNCIKFQSPNIEKAVKTMVYVVSNEIKSKPLDITFCPCLYSASEVICNIGEEIKIKLYGDGFSEKNTEILFNNSKCVITKFINNKIIEIRIPNTNKCGIIDIYAYVKNIKCISALKFKVRPVILSFNCEYSNNRGIIDIRGMGLNSITSVVFMHEGEVYEISKINYCKNANENSIMNESYETISINYEEISFYKDMIEKNLEHITLDIIIKNSETESIPYKWVIKNNKYKVDYEAEVIKAIHICNNFLESNYVSSNYHYIKAYSDNLASTLSKLIIQICELPEMYSDKNAEQILINGFNEEYNDIINNKMVYNVILQMIKILLYKLSSGILYENITINIDSPLLIYAKENEHDSEMDYLFQEYIDLKSYKLYNVLHAHELSQCIQYKIIDNDIEFKFNEEILNNICDNFDRLFIHKKFILCNNNGHFCGSEAASKEGTVAELFAYKIASSITGMPEAEIAIIDIENIKSKIVNYENSSEITLGMQLKNILTNDTVLKSLYDQIKRNDMDRFHKSNNMFEQMPFKCGDKLKLKLLISCKIKYTNNDSTGINKNELIYKSCDPDIYEKNKPIDYLLNHSATEIRATNDYYEITLG